MKKSFVASLLAVSSLMSVEGAQCYTGPLKPCEFSVSVRGGAEYMWYAENVRNDYINSVAIFDGENPLLVIQEDTQRTSKFEDQFELPWTVVGEIGFALSSCTEVFADFHYGEANGRSSNYSLAYDEISLGEVVVKPAETYRIHEKYSDLEYLGGTLGLRHYFEDFCGCIYPFVGVKAGVRHYDQVRAEISAVRNDVELTSQTERVAYYDSHNVVHGGFQVGLDMRFSDCFQVVAMLETLGSCGLKPHRAGKQFVYPEINEGEDFASSLNVPSRRTLNVLSFPVTIGMKLSF